MTTPLRRPEGRYDAPRRLPRQLTYLLAALLGLLLLTLSFAAYRSFSGGSTRGTVLGYDVLSGSEVVVRVEVRHSTKGGSRCVVVVYDRDHVTVGHGTVTIHPHEATPTEVTLRLTTSERAASAEVTGCAP